MPDSRNIFSKLRHRLNMISLIGMLAAFAALVLWIHYLVLLVHDKRDMQDVRRLDAQIDNFQMVRTDMQGQLLYTLNAQHLDYYAWKTGSESVLQQPHVTRHTRPQEFMEVFSEKGLVKGEGDEVIFIDQVHGVSHRVLPSENMTLDTQYLTVLPKQNVVKTDQPVAIRRADISVLAGGMQYNSETQLLQMTRVRARYEKPDPSAIASSPQGKIPR